MIDIDSLQQASRVHVTYRSKRSRSEVTRTGEFDHVKSVAGQKRVWMSREDDDERHLILDMVAGSVKTETRSGLSQTELGSISSIEVEGGGPDE